MTQYISKDALVAEINKRIIGAPIDCYGHQRVWAYNDVKDILDTLEVKDPYEQCVQYSSIKDGIEEHAETYSYNIESDLFNQLTKEQQALWQKEIEQACISGGEAGVELARDPRYKENHEVKEVDLEKEIYDAEKRFGDIDEMGGYRILMFDDDFRDILRHFFELGLKTKQESNDEIKIGETQIYLEDDGGEQPYNGKQWLDLSCIEYEIPKALFNDGDNVEILIRKVQKG